MPQRKMVFDFDRKIEILMADKDLSIADLAKRCRLTRQNIYQIRKSDNPRPKTVKRIAHGLGVPVTYFYDE